jgi:aminoglycoside phosphotransferase (APT) family kinase protein
MQVHTPLATGRTAEIFAWDDGRVLKLFRPGWSMDVAEHEAEVARIIYAAGVPVPRIDELAEVDGRAGIIYERITGPSLLKVLSTRPWRLPAVARTLAEVHAEVHRHTVSGLPCLHEVLARRIQNASSLPADHQQIALAALDSLAAQSGTEGARAALCHGDYHPDNVLLSARGPLVIDWENAAIGDPHADVARLLLLVRASVASIRSAAGRSMRRAVGSALIALYLRNYRQLLPCDSSRLAAWELPVTAARLAEGISEEEAHLLARVRWLIARTGE